MKRNRRMIVSAAAGISQRTLQVASTLVSMPLLLKALGPTGFGIWGAAASLAWLSMLADVGTGAALVTLVARASAAGDLRTARRYVAGTLFFGSLLGLCISLADIAAWLVSGSTNCAYLISILGLALNIPLNAANNLWMALQKAYFASLWEAVNTILNLVAVVAATFFTHNILIYVGSVYAALVLANLGSLVHLLWLHPELRPDAILVPLSVIKGVARQGMLYFILTLVAGLLFLMDNVLALSLLGPTASARMTIALRICIMALTALSVVSQPLWPAVADAAERQDWQWIRGTSLRAGSALVGITAVGAVVLLLLGQPLLNLWLKDTLGIDQSLLWAIAAWALVQALIRVPCMLLNGLSIIRYQLWVWAVGTATAFALKLVLTKYIGVAGILWGTTVACLLIVFPVFSHRLLKWSRNPLSNGAEGEGGAF